MYCHEYVRPVKTGSAVIHLPGKGHYTLICGQYDPNINNHILESKYLSRNASHYKPVA